MFKCCIFDLDGTLLNTITTITHYIEITLEAHGLRGTDEEEVVGYVGNGAQNLIWQVLRARNIDDSDFFATFYREYSDAYDEAPIYLTRPYDGICELLSELSEKGIKLAVLSNKPDFATRSIIDTFFGGLFDVVHGGREGIPLKPAPDGIFGILSELGVKGDECCYIGDSEVDVKTGIAASLDGACAVTWGFRKPEVLRDAGASRLIDTVEELRSFILSGN